VENKRLNLIDQSTHGPAKWRYDLRLPCLDISPDWVSYNLDLSEENKVLSRAYYVWLRPFQAVTEQ